MRLTKANIAKYALPDGKAEAILFDDDVPGFGLRVRAGGKRTWVAQYRVGTKQRRLSLGSTDKVDADEARKRAKAALSKVQLGLDPQTEKHSARALAAVTLGSTIDDYLTRYAEKELRESSLSDVRRYLQVNWAPLHEVAIHQITRPMVASRLAVIAERNGPYAANRARAALSAFYNWALGEGFADLNPVVGTNKATAEVSRDRVLSPEELSLIWQLAGDGEYGAIVRLLILTGQRREEVGGICWSELGDPTMWALPDNRTKNGLPHDVPLPSMATAILGDFPLRDGRDLVFGTSAGPFQGWSKAKTALDARMLGALREKHGEKAVLKPWRLHDIRRTVATRLADTVGTQPHVIEAILNHISGHKAGVAGIYNRATYAAEKRAALDAWSALVTAGR